jgi:hypothetical protein
MVQHLPTIEEVTVLAEVRALRVRLGSALQHVPMRLDRYGVARPDYSAWVRRRIPSTMDGPASDVVAPVQAVRSVDIVRSDHGVGLADHGLERLDLGVGACVGSSGRDVGA